MPPPGARPISFGWLSLESGATGARRWCSSSPTRWCAGIGTGFAGAGLDDRNVAMRVGHRSIRRSALLVREMATANPLWGAPRIHGELRTLGVDVSERTVSRLLKPADRPRSQTWKTFLTNHLTAAAA